MADTKPNFSLKSLAGDIHAFPGDGPHLVVFVKEDCETCNTAAPVVEAFHKAYGDKLRVLMVGQSGADNATLKERHHLTLPIMDDATSQVSFDWEIEIVPSVFWIDADGTVQTHFEGFVREEWEKLSADLAQRLDMPQAQIDWESLPVWRPGCGSKHLYPEIYDKLRASAAGTDMLARRIEIAPADDVIEFMFDQGFSDGLPLVPPTPERVLRMLEGTHRSGQDLIATVPPNMGEATVEKIAINAVMAGCKPEYMPVIIAALEAVCTDAFNIHGVTATTMGAAPVIVVNGPIRDRIGMNKGLGALGSGNRANATIGRALRLIVGNVGGGKPGGVERSTLGNPMKYTMCFAENEERSPWPPLHVERGFKKEDSVVTVFAMTGGPVHIVDQESRKPEQVAGSIGLGLEGVFLPKLRNLPIDALLVVCPEHIDTLMSEGDYTKDRLRARIQEVTRRPLSEMVADEMSGAGIPKATAEKMGAGKLKTEVPKFAGPEYIHIVVAGSDAGKFSSAFHGWATGEIGSQSVSRKVDLG
jgi:thiol-disulfide isomerase/thioredoxin